MAAKLTFCCVILVFGYIVKLVSADQKTITAESGRSVSLPCRAPNNNIPITVVEWNRPDLEPEEYVLLYRDEGSVLEHQHPSFEGRVDLQDRQMKDGDISLTVLNVTTADTGTYECRVIQKATNGMKRAIGKGDPICIINLSVPPGPPGGHRGAGVKEGGSVGLTVGLSVFAVLVVVGGGGAVYLIYRNNRIRAQT